MSEWGEPRRWNESELPEELRRMLESAEGDDDPELVRSLEARLAPVLGWPAGGLPGASGASGAGSASGASAGGGVATAGTASAGALGAASAGGVGAAATVKVLAATVITVGVIGGGVWLASEEPPAAPSPAQTSPAPQAPEPAAPATRAPEPVAPVAPHHPPLNAPLADEAPARPRIRRPALPRVVPEETHASEPAPTTSRAEPTAAALLAEEVAIVESIRRALDTSPARALGLAEEHRARFGDGVLGPERELLRIEALLTLGREDEARAIADDLLAHHPRSAHARRIRRLLPEDVDNRPSAYPMNE